MFKFFQRNGSVVSNTDVCRAQEIYNESNSKQEQHFSNSKSKNPSQLLHLSGSAILFLLLGFAVVFLCRGYIRSFLQWLENLDDWQGILIFVVLFTVVSFPMTWGYIVLNLAAGYLYGFLTGLIVVVISVLCGIFISFMVCRHFLQRFVQSKLESDTMKALMRVVEGRRGFKVMALTRLTPFPFGLQNGLFAITKISVRKYIVASGIGLLPTQALNAYFGSTVRSVEGLLEEQEEGYILLLIQAIITLFLTIYIVQRAKLELNRTYQESELENVIMTGKVSMNGNVGHYKTRQGFSRDLESLDNQVNPVKLQSHKRSHSASIVLSVVNEIDDYADMMKPST